MTHASSSATCLRLQLAQAAWDSGHCTCRAVRNGQHLPQDTPAADSSEGREAQVVLGCTYHFGDRSIHLRLRGDCGHHEVAGP